MSAKSDQDKKWLGEFIAAAVEMSGWIALPVIAALFIGQWLDEKQGTGNLYFLSLTGVAFIISCVGLGLVGKKYLVRVEGQSLKDKTEQNKIDGNKSSD